ncbi:PIN domain-like protein [Mycena pura]|uniref:PIN domain-like protein n=1 Tax=Mycena pura TaxID=153505 RepID=A0AAD6YI36_9AGAR|nr:PIN domain-like protein [Mycena pura]
MGVLGLTPFLQRSLQALFPNLVKQLPDRFRGLAGKKIVLDGTLITQRLHFAQVPHDYRHVLGWYRLVKDLHSAGVSTICVFDGKERSAAKAREAVLQAERRRDVQQLAVARASIELDRIKRLTQLANVLDHFKKLDPAQRGRVSVLFRQIFVGPGPPSSSLFSQKDTILSDALHCQEEASNLTSAYNVNDPAVELSAWLEITSTATKYVSLPPVESNVPSHTSDTLCNSNIEPSVNTTDEANPSPTARSLLQLSSSISPPRRAPYDESKNLSPLERPFPGTRSPELLDTMDVNIAPPFDITLDALVSLYLDFRDSLRKLASLTPVAPYTSGNEQQVGRTEYSMTKTQLQLTADEAKFWDDLASNGSSPEFQPPDETLATLASRADIMSQSYQRRINPPTTRTYEESKELLRTLGVPCIESTGTYEAEALASSLVLNGLADYVASEDTDVIIYEAPLLRNITNRNGPLIMLSGSEIRNALQLDRTSFVDFALLLGTDFSQRIKNVGPARALKFIQQHKSIERILEVEKKLVPRVPTSAYLAEVEQARMVFMTLPPVPDARLMKQDPDQEGLSVVLQRCGLGKLLLGDEEWDYEEALQGNYFSDDPSAC